MDDSFGEHVDEHVETLRSLAGRLAGEDPPPPAELDRALEAALTTLVEVRVRARDRAASDGDGMREFAVRLSTALDEVRAHTTGGSMLRAGHGFVLPRRDPPDP